ncbi:hypothetical protein G4Z16_06685 [Streptomyces bathyalis]|uniref:Uncharacterized protein n=1 Tax=Streptomyces bathyalis TaxID=2710756 RepID=A0A7T1T4B8_9ACTN|nr:hypothetical protein [Streptomyces bathyalis]QPP06135.1 hypothetical protein G4Z16_06685 [Streptomyces bathyalis]
MNHPDRQTDAEVGDAEFLTDTRDRVQARALRKQLQQLAGGEAGRALQEMAKEVLAGRVGLREALRVPAYAEALGERVNTFRKDWERMSPEEQKAQREEAQRFLDAQRDEIEREQDEQQKPAGGSPKHSSRGWQL